MRYHIIFSYDGSNFFGYQKQPRKRTVQGEFEKVLKQINKNKKTSLSSSGRTDAKVHALGQSAHFDLNIKITSNKLKLALNSLLPDDIYVLSAQKVKEDFHARFDVKSKEYIYKVSVEEYNPLERNYVYQYNKPLDIKRMKKASKYLIGIHDFKSFVKSDIEKDDYIRQIYKIKISFDKKIGLIIFSRKGNGFMRYMVRNIVGSLIEVGSGKENPNYIKEVLERQDRKSAGKCAPANGLYLKDVKY